MTGLVILNALASLSKVSGANWSEEVKCRKQSNIKTKPGFDSSIAFLVVSLSEFSPHLAPIGIRVKHLKYDDNQPFKVEAKQKKKHSSLTTC